MKRKSKRPPSLEKKAGIVGEELEDAAREQ
jgi:hypothetical protein